MAKHWIVEISEKLVETFRTVYRETREALELNKKKAAEQAGLSPQTIGYVEEQERSPTLISFLQLALGLGLRPSVLLARVEERLGLDKLFVATPPRQT